MAFFQSAVGTLQTLVIALGAGLGIWGAINLMERSEEHTTELQSLRRNTNTQDSKKKKKEGGRQAGCNQSYGRIRTR